MAVDYGIIAIRSVGHKGCIGWDGRSTALQTRWGRAISEMVAELTADKHGRLLSAPKSGFRECHLPTIHGGSGSPSPIGALTATAVGLGF